MKSKKPRHPPPVIRHRSDHCISRKHIDEDALKVLYRLHRKGFKAYLVGGGVRDLLLGRKPKDFDVSTDAHPNKIKKLFGNCFLIGRRFRLAHIRFGPKVIEVSTFRREPEHATDEDGNAVFHSHDNTFGTPEEDARRRDFTINGLFYDIGTYDVIDHVGGLDDLDGELVRCIGDPHERFIEDPVRMVRAVRFASRLGFWIEQEAFKAIREHGEEITKASAPRMLEEIYKLFGYQSGEAAFRMLHKTHLLNHMFPELAEFIRDGGAQCFWNCLKGHDRDMAILEQTTPALMLGTLYCAPFRRALDEARREDRKVTYEEVAKEVLAPVMERYRLPKKVYYGMVHMFGGQRRFDNPKQRFSKRRFVQQEFFPEAIELYGIYRAAAGLDKEPLLFWQELHREHASASRAQDGRRRPRRRGGRGRRRSRRK